MAALPIPRQSVREKPMKSVFNLSAKALQRDRSTKLNFKANYIRDEVASRIADRLYDIKRDFNHILDYKCGSGHILHHLGIDKCKKITLCDTSSAILDTIVKPPIISAPVLDIVHSDTLEEVIAFPENTFDAVTSNLSLHWQNDLLGMLIQSKNVLKPDGVFIGALLGGDTLFELRTSLQLAETERQGGIASHISPLADFKDMGALLTRAGFSLTTVDLDEIVVEYPSIYELIADLNAMGEGNCIDDRSFLHRDTLLAAGATYKAVYGTKDNTIPATFQVIFMIGWKPDPSQFKPIERGTAKRSMKELNAAPVEKIE